MNGDRGEAGAVIDAVLPSGTVVRVRVAEQPTGGIGSVGLVDKLHLEDALAQIAEVAALVREKLEPAMPSKVTVQFGVSFSAISGKLSSLVFEGKGEASLTVTMEWERPTCSKPSESGT